MGSPQTISIMLVVKNRNSCHNTHQNENYFVVHTYQPIGIKWEPKLMHIYETKEYQTAKA